MKNIKTNIKTSKAKDRVCPILLKERIIKNLKEQFGNEHGFWKHEGGINKVIRETEL